MKALVLFRDDKDIKKLLGADLAKRVADAQPVNGMINPNFAHPDYDYVTISDSEIKSDHDAREFGGKMYTRFKSKVELLDIIVPKKYSAAVGEGVHMAAYEFTKYKETTSPKLVTGGVMVNGQPCAEGISPSIALARDFVTEPGNKLFPQNYAYRINDALSGLGITVKILHKIQLEILGFDLLLSVGQGSVKDSYVVVMEYMNGADGERPVALVGKGVTFDTGGISLKPSAGMGDMKYDMGGSAAVVGAMHAIASHGVKKNVVGIVGLVENMPDGNAIKPGDVVTSLSGKTVENLNTDAEGRLVLADILTYVQSHYDPQTVIDLATLTGAILVSLGKEMAGLFTNSTALEGAIKCNGLTYDEKYWRMPMGQNWNKMIDSDIADVKNIGGGRYGGSTTAAEFLYRFVDNDRAFAHLDIAGMAWEESGKAVCPKGATAFGVATLMEFVKNEGSTDFPVDEEMKY
jgi:leucyl aminopeptidase